MVSSNQKDTLSKIYRQLDMEQCTFHIKVAPYRCRTRMEVVTVGDRQFEFLMVLNEETEIGHAFLVNNTENSEFTVLKECESEGSYNFGVCNNDSDKEPYCIELEDENGKTKINWIQNLAGCTLPRFEDIEWKGLKGITNLIYTFLKEIGFQGYIYLEDEAILADCCALTVRTGLGSGSIYDSVGFKPVKNNTAENDFRQAPVHISAVMFRELLLAGEFCIHSEYDKIIEWFEGLYPALEAQLRQLKLYIDTEGKITNNIYCGPGSMHEDYGVFMDADKMMFDRGEEFDAMVDDITQNMRPMNITVLQLYEGGLSSENWSPLMQIVDGVMRRYNATQYFALKSKYNLMKSQQTVQEYYIPKAGGAINYEKKYRELEKMWVDHLNQLKSGKYRI